MSDGEKEAPRLIVVTDYDPSWASLFLTFRDALWPHVHDIAVGFEHVGSTAVPGLPAKPIIDMDIIVSDTRAASEAIGRLLPLGYVHRGEMGVSGRHAFFHPQDKPAHHLYVCLLGSVGLNNHRTFRDHLRTHPEDLLEYGRLKRELAARYPHDIDAYIDGKTSFIVGILKQVGMTPDELVEVVGANQMSREDSK